MAVCRCCGVELRHTFVDLGMTPLCESFLPREAIHRMEPFYPLRAWVCSECFLVQLEEFVAPAEIFSEYAYFSSYSDSWLAHARAYSLAIVERLSLDARSLVVELASNDGYLLKNFVEMGIPCLGIEPAANVARVAVGNGVPTMVDFFGTGLAERLVAEGHAADLIAANNVLAQVPDLNDFLAGMATLLKPRGIVTIEFPHLERLMMENQFDTIYHEHFSYFSLYTTELLFERHGLEVFDVEELRTHGGSLRVYGQHKGAGFKAQSDTLLRLRAREAANGVDQLDAYFAFDEQVKETKRKLLTLLIELKREGKRIAGYGAPGKGNTLLNYCGIRTDFLDFTCDRNPYKHGKYTPGTHIPILPPDAIDSSKPDYVFILPWNLKDEIIRQLAHIRDWGGKFIVPIPEAQIVE